MGIGIKNQLVTIGDLEQFKAELLAVIAETLAEKVRRPEKKWLKSAAARKLIGISPGKLQAIRESGMLPFTKIGGNIYYDQDDLFKLFEKHKVCHK